MKQIQSNLYLFAIIGLMCNRLLDQSPNSDDVNLQDTTVELIVPAKILDGDAPGVKAKGLRSNEKIRIHLLRRMERWEQDGDNWARKDVVLHAWAEFLADGKGVVDVDTARPLAGVYSKVDPLALLRNGYVLGDEALKDVFQFEDSDIEETNANQVAVRLERAGKIESKAAFRMLGEDPDLTFKTVAELGLHAVYAKPSGDGPFPEVISLHGSEGGSAAKARSRAAQFASHGFATLAVNYFAFEHEGIEGLQKNHIEVPIETLMYAKQWLMKQTEVDANSINVYGASKGAEFALLGATKYKWIKRVVALVPSDVVWAGYGEDGGLADQKSSWSFEEKPLKFIPLFSFEPRLKGMYRTNTERYSRSRNFHRDLVSDVRIPIETTEAKILLLAGDRDEVWDSSNMSRAIVERMAAANKLEQVHLRSFPKAGHQISGTGTFPVRLYGVDSPDPNAKDIVAEGAAAAEAWKLTLEFLRPDCNSTTN